MDAAASVNAEGQPDYMKAPDQDSPQHILNALNDDCLRTAFEELKLVDLSAAAAVCVRFHQNAVEAFKSKFKGTIKVERGSEFEGQPEYFEKVLRHFGLFIHSLSINQTVNGFKDIDIWEMINEHIRAVNDTRGTGQIVPQLKEFKLEWSTIDGDGFKQLVKSNPILQKLSLRSNKQKDADSIVQSIFELNDLVELEIVEVFGKLCEGLISCTWDAGQFHLLKKLTLVAMAIDFTPLLLKLVKNAVPLEHLTIGNIGFACTVIEAMSKLTKLNVIVLTNIGGLTDDHIVMLVKSLPHLHTLHLMGWTGTKITRNGLRNMLMHTNALAHLILENTSGIASIKTDDYHFILNTVMNRPEKTKLTIELAGYGAKMRVPIQLMSANSNWLWIEYKDDSW